MHAAAAPERADGPVRGGVERDEVEHHDVVGPAQGERRGKIVEIAGRVANQALAPQPDQQAVGRGVRGKHQDPHRHKHSGRKFDSKTSVAQCHSRCNDFAKCERSNHELSSAQASRNGTLEGWRAAPLRLKTRRERNILPAFTRRPAMLLRNTPGWTIAERDATPERLFFGRRAALAAAGLAGTGGLALAAAPGGCRRAAARPCATRATGRSAPSPASARRRPTTTITNSAATRRSPPPRRSCRSAPGRSASRAWWSGPAEFALDDLLRRMPIEERVYRLRCVEAWSMVVPWTGFQLSELLKLVAPLGSARYVRLRDGGRSRPSCPACARAGTPGPISRAARSQEAANELSFMVVGAYGKPLPPQNGGPIRVHFPWKYGFKSGKSLVRVVLTDQRPKSFWEAIQPQEYGFWANVNPEVPHPRWSQATRAGARDQRAGADADLQRLWRVRRRALRGPAGRAAVGLRAMAAPC